MSDYPIPSRLYRYRSCATDYFEDELRAVVERQEQFFSSVKSQNDPFDCNPNFVASSDREVLQLYEKIGKKHLVSMGILREYYPNFSRAELRRLQKRDFSVSAPNIADSNPTLDQFVNEIRTGSRIICLSETWNNPLMWAHYGAGHNGIVWGFEPDVDTAIESDHDIPLKVRYVENRPTLKTTDLVCWLESERITDPLLTSRGYDAFNALVLTKPKVWEYEEEWRVQVRFEGQDAYKEVPSLQIREVLIGARVETEKASLVEEICGDKVPVFRVGMDSQNFELIRL